MMLDASDGEDASSLLGEWTLLLSFKSFPHLGEMTARLKQAAALLHGKSSRVILPTAPWCFGDYCQLAEFHTMVGEADREAGALEEYVMLYSRLTNGHGAGADALFRAELCFYRGEMSDAQVFAYKALFLAENKRQSIIQLGAARLLAEIALLKADAAGWQSAIGSMERAASYPFQNAFVVRSVLDTIRGVLLTELKDQASIAGWLKNGEFSGRTLPAPMINNALFVHLLFLLHQGELARLVGTAQAIPPEVGLKTVFSELLLSLILAVGHVSLGNRAQAASLVRHAAAIALPDGLIFLFASFSWLLQGLADELIEQEYPALFDRYAEAKTQFGLGWDTLRNTLFPDNLPSDLTAREYEVAKLAAEGLHNSEIAEKLSITESTVRTHLRTAFQKLDVDRRAKLAERLEAP